MSSSFLKGGNFSSIIALKGKKATVRPKFFKQYFEFFVDFLNFGMFLLTAKTQSARI